MSGGPFSPVSSPTPTLSNDKLEWFGVWCDTCKVETTASPCKRCGSEDDLRFLFIERKRVVV